MMTKAKIIDKGIYDYNALLTRIRAMGGGESETDAMCRHYGTKKAYAIFLKNPFSAVEFGIPFAMVEQAYTFPQMDERRAEGLVWAAMNLITAGGSTRAKVERVIRVCWWIEEKAGRYTQTPAVVLGAAMQERLKIFGTYASTPYYALLEKRLAKALKIIEKKSPVLPSVDVAAVESELGVTYDDTQRKALSSLLSAPISVLTGGPGTGKTTLLRGIISAHKATGRPLVLCAPTGRAAAQMRESTGEAASTVHKLLCIRPYMTGGLVAEDGVLPEGALVVVDEASMLDIEVAEVLVSAAADARAQLLLVGDIDQLEPVGVGSFFRDVILCGRYPVARLEVVHRNAGIIAENAAKIRAGLWDLHKTVYGKVAWDSIKDEPFITKNLKSADDIARWALAIHGQKYDKEHPHDVKIFTPVKASSYAVSTAKINSALHEAYHGKDKSLAAGGQRFSVGEPIVITKNLYELGVMNGDLGTVTAVSSGAMCVDVGGEQVLLTGADLQHVDLAYAMTVHKAQGASCACAIVLLPSRPRSLMTRRMAYVAVTRATEQVVILHECYSLEAAILDESTRPRATGLLEMLEGGKK